MNHQKETLTAREIDALREALRTIARNAPAFCGVARRPREILAEIKKFFPNPTRVSLPANVSTLSRALPALAAESPKILSAARGERKNDFRFILSRDAARLARPAAPAPDAARPAQCNPAPAPAPDAPAKNAQPLPFAEKPVPATRRNTPPPDIPAARVPAPSLEAIEAAFELLARERRFFYRSTAAGGADEDDTFFPQEKQFQELADFIKSAKTAAAKASVPAAVSVPVPPARLIAAFRRRLATLAAENDALRELLAETETLNLARERAPQSATFPAKWNASFSPATPPPRTRKAARTSFPRPLPPLKSEPLQTEKQK